MVDKDITKWTLDGVKTKGVLLNIYDGDTFTLLLPVCCKEYAFSCRLNGIDTPEIRTKNRLEKKQAKLVKEYVKNILETTPFEVHCGDFDKYGRILCEIIFDDGTSLSSHLIEKGFAYKYTGGKKKLFDEWFKTEEKIQ